ncbi:MAG: hypothetical protein JNM39_11345 [Bdellovibrionaceae bacterium]|nr:hypothetical protein [Pseudobdellovibrionaceae bacterium]
MAVLTFVTPKVLVQATNFEIALFEERTTLDLVKWAVGIGAMSRTKVHRE